MGERPPGVVHAGSSQDRERQIPAKAYTYSFMMTCHALCLSRVFSIFPLCIFSLNSNLASFGGISKGWVCKVEGGILHREGVCPLSGGLFPRYAQGM